MNKLTARDCAPETGHHPNAASRAEAGSTPHGVMPRRALLSSAARMMAQATLFGLLPLGSALAQPAAGAASPAAGSIIAGERAAPPTARVTLLLPPREGSLGRVAEALRSGFRNANALAGRSIDVQEIHCGDDLASLGDAMRQAADAGSALIVGPLTRNGVTTLLELGPPPALTLLLNQPDGVLSGSANVFMFGLPIEEEARLVARQALQGLLARRPTSAGPGAVAAEATPAGVPVPGAAAPGSASVPAAPPPAGVLPRSGIVASASTVSRRAAQAFADEWRAMGGEPPVMLDSASAAVAARTMFADTPVDMVFLATDQTTARAVKAALPAGIELWATSQVTASAVPDLDGVRVLEQPMRVNPQHAAVMSYPRPNARYSADLQRIYALGIDAFRIAEKLLAGQRSFEIDGVTGFLRLDAARDVRIDRTPLVAEIRSGLPVLASPAR